MTRLELKDALQWEGRIDGNTEALSQLNGIISEAIVFIGQSHPELLLMESVDYDLDTDNPTDFVPALGIDRVELFGGNAVVEPCTIPEEGKVVGPAPIPGWPKAYCVEGNASESSSTPKGLSVRLIGGESLDVGVDGFTVWYKKIPLITDDTHLVPDPWIPYLKKECLSRLNVFRVKNDIEGSKAYLAGATQALQAEIATDTQSTAATN